MFHSTIHHHLLSLYFFFNDTATTEIYTLSLHDALPIYSNRYRHPARYQCARGRRGAVGGSPLPGREPGRTDRKSTRLNSSHSQISYAVFCLKKKKKKINIIINYIKKLNKFIKIIEKQTQ